MSSAQNAYKSENNSVKSFLTSAGINFAIWAIEIGAFVALKNRFARIYSPRTFLPPEHKRAEKLETGPWRWLYQIVMTPSNEIIRKNGLDAYMYVRFLGFITKTFFVFFLISWPIVLPANAVNMPGGNRDGLARLSFGNIDATAQNRYWAHLLVAYILTGYIIWQLRDELDHFVHMRHQFLIAKQHARTAQAKTVLITSLPKELTNEKDLTRFFSFIPGGVKRVWIYRNSPTLPEMYDERLKACQMLEKAACEMIQKSVKGLRKGEKTGLKPSGPLAVHVSSGDAAELQQADAAGDARAMLATIPRPRHRLGSVPLLGNKVDTIRWCTSEIVRLNDDIARARALLPQSEPHGSAFVQCNLQMGAHVLAQCVSYHEPLKMSQKWIEVAPDDIVWANIDDGAYEVRARFVISWVVTIALVLLFTLPAAFFGMLSNVDQLCGTFPWITFVCDASTVVQGIIQGVAPPVFLAILFIVVPYIFQALAWYECIPRRSLISVSVYRRYFLFLIIHGFLIVTVSSGLTAAIPAILNNPGSTVAQLAIHLPDASVYFLTYVITQGFSGAGTALVQIAPLVLYFANRYFFGSTPRQSYSASFFMPKVDFGFTLPRTSLLVAIALSYSIISPIINGLAMFAFFLFYIAWKYLFLYVMDQPDHSETGGLFFPMLINNVFTGLYIEQLCLVGLFFLATDDQGNRSSIAQGVLMVILMLITIAAQVLYNNMFDPITDFLPMSLATQKLAHRFERERRRKIPAIIHAGEEAAGAISRTLEHEEEEFFDLFSRDHITNNIKSKLRQRIGRRPSSIRKKENGKKDDDRDKKDKGKGTDKLIVPKSPPRSPPLKSMFDQPPTLPTLPSFEGADKSRASVDSKSSQGSQKSKGSNVLKELVESAGPSMQIAAAAPAQKSQIKDAVAEMEEGHKKRIIRPDGWEDSDGDSDTDDDLEDHAFDHPSTYLDVPWIWLPKDPSGVAELLVDEIRKGGVDASTEGAKIDEDGLVSVTRNPPDEAWAGGVDL